MAVPLESRRTLFSSAAYVYSPLAMIYAMSDANQSIDCFRDPRNVPGPFYVQKDCCMLCYLAVDSAPELLAPPECHYGEWQGCRFKRQPQTSEEIDRAIKAMWVSEIAALRYSGSDPAILKRLCDLGLRSQCDVLEPPTSARVPTEGQPTSRSWIQRLWSRFFRHGMPD